ncbi:hypothetical protein HAX54_047719 [Datura stramonium]|uniref:Uncharacterized protein n=1 Tax=Datura stramonium TaxID=4076 RepID=A0ABS8WL14_DATST|nr:hypothetical protein [Datura stramonium]
MRETRTSLQECLGEKQALNIESTIGNFNSTSQRLCFPENEYHLNVLDSNEFPINFDEPLLEGYSIQPPAVPSLVPPNDFFAGINDWNQELELDNFNCASQRLYFSNDGHHFSTFNNLSDNGHHFNVFDANGFPINFNEPLQEGYSPQPPAVPSLAPPDDFFTGLDNWNQEPELNNFNGDHNVSISIIVKAFILAVFLAAVAVSAQEPSLAPAPSPDAGSGFSLPVSGALIGTSLLMSLFALLRH